MLKVLLKTTIAAAALAATLQGVSAETLSAPSGHPILQISGTVEKANAGTRANLDLAMLEGIGATTIQTSTPWTEGRPSFEGVLVRDLLRHVGGKGKTITAVALNDYKIEISAAEVEKYPVILAYKMDGKPLKIRDKGPLWIVYPQDDFPELNNAAVQSKWVWQVKELRID
jgi:hypothetical protein